MPFETSSDDHACWRDLRIGNVEVCMPSVRLSVCLSVLLPRAGTGQVWGVLSFELERSRIFQAEAGRAVAQPLAGFLGCAGFLVQGVGLL